HKYDLSILDFQKSLEEASLSSGQKAPYSLVGLAICFLNKGELNEAALYYEKGIQVEPLFSFPDKTAFINNIRTLEDVKKYYISEFEKSQLAKFINLQTT
ncbi:MAG: hypothetical protein AAF502_01285, partial [Bacteroidota bacterium]